MKKNLLQVMFAVLLFSIPHINFGQAPNLGSTSSFALFTAAGAINNTGPSIITGDVGTDVGALNGFPPGVVFGQIYDETTPESAQAATDVALAYMELAGETCGMVLGTTLGNGQMLLPDVYCLGAASTLNGELILDAQNDPNAIFIFQINGAFSTSTLASVSLINGAAACNVYWQVNGAFTLGENSVFRGTVITNGAINLLEGSSILGRALSQDGAISTHNISATNCAGCPSPPFVVITETNVEVCGATGATFNYTVENGPTTSFTSDGDGDLSLTSLPNGTATFTYTPSAAEASTGAVVTITATIADPDGGGPCLSSTDNATVTVQVPANAGTATAPAAVCDNSTMPIDLFSLLVGEQAGGVWTRATGTGGSFDANAGTFTPAPGSTSSTFTYTVMGVAPCSDDEETVTVNITPQLSAGTGSSISVCNNSTDIIMLADLLTDEANGGTWTLQNGSPDPGNNFNAANGTLDVNELSGGTYNFVYTVTNIAPCTNEEAVVTVVVFEAVLIEAGNSQTVCATKKVDLLTIGASISGGATTGTWSIQEMDSNGMFLDANMQLLADAEFSQAAFFMPSDADAARGFVTLVLTSDNPDGPCDEVEDTVIVTVLKVDCGTFPWKGN